MHPTRKQIPLECNHRLSNDCCNVSISCEKRQKSLSHSLHEGISVIRKITFEVSQLSTAKGSERRVSFSKHMNEIASCKEVDRIQYQ